jgi:hypothetical protein
VPKLCWPAVINVNKSLAEAKEPLLFLQTNFPLMQKSEKEFSPQESLQLIQSMIETTKSSISDSSHYFLLWGWATMLGCLGQYILLMAGYPKHYYAWFITLVAVVVHVFFILRDRKKEKVKTFINEANGYLWSAIGFSFMVLAFVFSRIGWQYCFPIYILLYGLGTYVSGGLIKFKPLQIGGLLNFLIAAITVYLPYNNQMLMCALAILTSYIIPGHLLRIHYRKTHLG